MGEIRQQREEIRNKSFPKITFKSLLLSCKELMKPPLNHVCFLPNISYAASLSFSLQEQFYF